MARGSRPHLGWSMVDIRLRNCGLYSASVVRGTATIGVPGGKGEYYAAAWVPADSATPLHPPGRGHWGMAFSSAPEHFDGRLFRTILVRDILSP
jgi:hypothetical protein